MSLSKSNKLINLLNYRLRVILADQRVITGHMLAYDTHMNLVIAECEEFRKTKPKGSKEEIELKRTLGLVILRGEQIVSISIDGPPPPSLESQKARMAQLAAGSGIGRPAGRGLPIAPPGSAPAAGLTGPARGLGAPAPVMMQPRGSAASAAPIPYARPMPGGAGMPARPGMPMPPPMGFRPGMPPPPGFRPGMPMPPGMRPPGGMPPPPFPPGHMGPPGGPMAPGMQRPNFNAPPPQGFRPPPGPGGPPPPRG